MTDPAPTSKLNDQLLEAVKRSRHLIAWVVGIEGVLLIFVTVIAGVLAALQLNEHQRVTQDVAQVVSSQCAFYYPIAIAAPDPAKTTKAGVQLIEGARAAMEGLGCTQTLPPPGRALLKLGHADGIRITS